MSAVSACAGSGGGDGDPSSAGVSDSCPYWSPDSRWIAFDRGPGGVAIVDKRSDVYVADASGQRVLRLTRTRAQDEVLGWLKRPLRVVYRSRDVVYTIAPRVGAQPQQLGRLRADDQVVALSHSGSRAFVVQGNRYVVVDFPRKTRRELARGRGIGSENAAWSRDDSAIAYETDDAFGVPRELVIARGNRVVRRKRIDGLAEGLAWSPDGRLLAYTATPASAFAGAEIWLLRPSDNSTRQLTRRPETENWSPTWSPDGKRIFYESDDGYRSITKAGTSDEEVADDRSLVCPALSPHGARIAFVRLGEGAGYGALAYRLLVVMNTDGSDKNPLPATSP